MDQRTSPEKRPIKLYWGTECTDGSYDLTITPEQIFFSSSHPNPNPDQLFWVIEIDTFQFGQIRKMLKKGAPDGFEKIANGDPRWQILFYDNQFKDTYKIPAEWTHQELQQFESYCKLQIQKQLEKYTLILNSCIDDPMKKVVFPTQDDPMGMKPKYFSEFMYDLQDWGQFQTKFEPPKILKIK